MVLIGLMITLASRCASPPAPPRPTHGLVDAVGRLVVVASGQARFMVIEHRTEPGRTFDEMASTRSPWWTAGPWEEICSIRGRSWPMSSHGGSMPADSSRRS